MEERSLHIVIVGHVDHGKSTLIGRLFYDTGYLSAEKVEELRKVSGAQGKDIEFAFMMDHLEEERSRGITIDIAHTFFKTDKRRYVIIDAPGHKEFLKNMITGSSQAEAALLLVDAAQGVQEQTRRHCYILGLLGLRQVAVIVNKMDMIDYSKEGFEKVKGDIESILARLNITPSCILPISARMGDNVAKKSGKLSWYKGPTVLEALDNLEEAKIEEKELRFPVQDVYSLDGQSIAVGRIEGGTLKKGQDVFILPEGKKARIVEIRKYMEDGIEEAATGQCVGVLVEGEELKRGHVVTDKATPTVTDTIHANIFWLVDKDYELGIPVTWKCATQEAGAEIKRILKRFDPATVEVIEKDALEIKPAEVAEVVITLDRAVVIDKFTDFPEMGRFVLEHAGVPIAGGIIV